MEEPPKIERILSSRGVSLSDAASLLKSFLSNIDQYHGHHDEEGGALDGGGGRRRQEELAYENDTNVEGRVKREGGGPRKSWQEREEEALIAQMDHLANDGYSASGVSDDVLERLRMITQSLCAEVEGKPLSASGMMMTSASRKDDAADDAMMRRFKEEGEGDDVGADDFIAESDAREEGRRQQHQPKKDKKKEKKAKKAAKKAKKDAKRKRAI